VRVCVCACVHVCVRVLVVITVTKQLTMIAGVDCDDVNNSMYSNHGNEYNDKNPM